MSKMLRLLALATAVLIFQPAVEAVGLGGATVRSHLNEQLDAVIPLRLQGNETIANTEVALAPIEDFRRVGLDYSAAMGQINFELVETSSGVQVQVTSDRPIRSPFVTFLLEVQSPSGRVLRQYTLLIDPSPDVRSRPESSTRSDTSTPSRRQTSPESRPTGSTPAADRERRSSISGDYTVQAGDTLYEIAGRMRPEGVDVNTMVAALYRNNPDAFYQDNINSLSRGARLDMPSQAAIEGLSGQQVNQLIRQHNAAWQQGRQRAADSAPVVEGGARDAAAVGQPERNEGRAEPRLALVPPSGDSEDAGADTEEIRRELNRTEEELASARLEAEDLRSRVDELENIADQQENVISLRDAELAQLREQLAEMRERGDAAETDAVAETRERQQEERRSEQERRPVERTEPPAQEQPEVEEPTTQTREEPAQRREMPTTVDSGSGMFSMLMLIGLLVLVLLLIVGAVFWFMRRRNAESSSTAAMMGGDDVGSQDAMTESLLIESVTEDPDDPQARLALLRFYFEAERKDAFVASAHEMHSRLESPEDNEHWQAARGMGQQIAPDDPLFGGDDSDDEYADDDDTEAAEPAFDDPAAFDEDFGADDDFDTAFEQTDNLKNLEEQLPPETEDSSDDDDWTSDEFGGVEGLDDSKPPSDTDIATTLAEEDDDEDLEGLDFDLGDTRDAEGTEFEAVREDEPAAKGAGDEDDSLDFGSGDDLDVNLDDDSLDEIADSLEDDEPAAEKLAASDDDDFNLDDSISDDVSTADDEGDELSFDLDSELGEDSDFDAEEPGKQPSADESETADASDEEEFDLDFDLGDEDLFAEGDAVATKLSLAEAYIEEGQAEDARGMLEEILQEGDDDQKAQAQALLDKL